MSQLEITETYKGKGSKTRRSVLPPWLHYLVLLNYASQPFPIWRLCCCSSHRSIFPRKSMPPPSDLATHWPISRQSALILSSSQELKSGELSTAHSSQDLRNNRAYFITDFRPQARCLGHSSRSRFHRMAFFPSLKQNFIAYRSSKMSNCISEIHLLWQSGFSRVYSNCWCSCSFEAKIIKIGQSSHKMYSNNIVNFQESTTILNACTKKSGNLWNAPRAY